MTNIVAILLLLTGGFAAAQLSGSSYDRAGQIGLAAVFAFTGFGHFFKRDAMVSMLPPALPARRAMVVFSGVFEILLAVGLLLPDCTKLAGLCAGAFLVLVAPINVYSAVERIDFGGHAAGPRYLWMRLPLQALLLVWTYWFAVHLA
jgi:uncharacterized membrane protein